MKTFMSKKLCDLKKKFIFILSRRSGLHRLYPECDGHRGIKYPLFFGSKAYIFDHVFKYFFVEAEDMCIVPHLALCRCP